ncbi:IclR family transcriptional regulator [Hephaestia caeni]|uniref:IclR family transcriptional regulator n=1 Tax=Hephaestia caeni TaxID=645617 RepID=A0A397NUM1_9SPHN|nr:helix-turn-helix domain-containing protein [Hephaestia caeni]RIA37101.1 IclR family transcriptional regulator [Hephaestia caeni]
MQPGLSEPDPQDMGCAGRKDGHVQSVVRALRLLESLNRRNVSSVAQLHKETSLPKPTIVRMLKTLVAEGYISSDHRQSGYSVTARVNSLSCGYHDDPMVVEMAKPWAIALTRKFGWPTGVGLLDQNAVVIRFSTIPDSTISPFHSSLNLRMGLISRALGLAYFAFCSNSEQKLLLKQLDEADKTLLGERESGWLDRRVNIARKNGFAHRDPGVEPRNSDTVAVPIMVRNRVAATIGLTYFRVGVSQTDLKAFATSLKKTAAEIGARIEDLA